MLTDTHTHTPRAEDEHVRMCGGRADWEQSTGCRAEEEGAAPASDQTDGTETEEAECTALDTPREVANTHTVKKARKLLQNYSFNSQ